MIKNICGIYKITSPTNKIYIGQSKNIEARKNSYSRLACIYQPRIYRSIKKYGWENHLFEIVEVCNEHELDEKEVFYIKKYNSFNSHNGLNNTSGGGRNKEISDETKKKMSLRKRGLKCSEDTKKKMSLSHKGINTWTTGRVHSMTTILRMSASQRKINKYWLRNKFGNKATHKRAIIDTKTHVIYHTLSDAALKNGLKISTLCAMLSGQNPNKTNLQYYK